MVGQPVYTKYTEMCINKNKLIYDSWKVIEGFDELNNTLDFTDGDAYDANTYLTVWQAYCHKPKEEK